MIENNEVLSNSVDCKFRNTIVNLLLEINDESNLWELWIGRSIPSIKRDCSIEEPMVTKDNCWL